MPTRIGRSSVQPLSQPRPARQAQQTPATVGTVKRSIGDAFIQRGNQRLPAAPGTQLRAGDSLVTGGNGRISLTFSDKSRFSVGPNSSRSLTPDLYSRNRDEFVTAVERGSLGTVSGEVARRARADGQLHTPTSILGVRG